MAPKTPSAFVLRPVRGWVLCAVTVLLLTQGCGHRRASMRPVFVTPEPALAPAPCAPGQNCGSAAAVTPGFQDSGAALTPPSSSTTTDPGVVPQSGSGSGEPPLDLKSIDKSSDKDNSEMTPPKSSQQGANTTTTRSSGRVTFKSRVEPFVNDPNDLFLPPKADRPWRYVVLHHSAHAKGSYAQIDREHRKNLGTDGCGYHFVIGNGSESPDGQIEVAKRWSDQKAGAHCRDAKTPDVNDYGIGICLVGNLDQSQPTPKQIEAARALVDYLRERYAIQSDHVGTHATLAQHATVCPGKNFPLQAILGGRNLALR